MHLEFQKIGKVLTPQLMFREKSSFKMVMTFITLCIIIGNLDITIHMPQKWNLSSVKCILRKTRANRILVKQCIVFIADCDAQCNQKLWIAIIERTYRKVETSKEF